MPNDYPEWMYQLYPHLWIHIFSPSWNCHPSHFYQMNGCKKIFHDGFDLHIPEIEYLFLCVDHICFLFKEMWNSYAHFHFLWYVWPSPFTFLILMHLLDFSLIITPVSQLIRVLQWNRHWGHSSEHSWVTAPSELICQHGLGRRGWE